MRRIIYIPAWHNKVDRGGIGPYQDILDRDDIPDDTRQKLEAEHIRFFEAAELYWDGVDAYIDEMIAKGDLNPSETHLYSDSAYLPTDTAARVFQRAADAGSRHFQVVIKLLSLGGNYVITEDKSSILNAKSLAERDYKVAKTIDRTLPPEHTGILIMGASHRVSRFLPEDINFTQLREDLVRLTDGDTGRSEISNPPEAEIRSSRSVERG